MHFIKTFNGFNTRQHKTKLSKKRAPIYLATEKSIFFGYFIFLKLQSDHKKGVYSENINISSFSANNHTESNAKNTITQRESSTFDEKLRGDSSAEDELSWRTDRIWMSEISV